MTNFGWDLPPGVTSLPGDHDMTISFTFTFPYTIYNDDQEPLQLVVDEWFDTHLDIDLEITTNADGSFNLMLTYEDDITADIRSMDYSDIEDMIIDYMNDDVRLIECHFDHNDDGLDITVDIHN